MGVGYFLINSTKKEAINYYHLPVNKMKEISGNPISAIITTWYLLNNRGNDIRFVPDSFIDENFNITDDIFQYKDVTDIVIEELIKNGILKDNGIEYIDEDDLSLYFRRLDNIWCE
jgi:hypothetical protein